MRYNEYIKYFKQLGVSIDNDPDDIVITVRLDMNFVSISNEHSFSHICVSIDPRTGEHPIALRIYNKCNYKIFHTNTHTVIILKGRLDIKDQYTINIH